MESNEHQVSQYPTPSFLNRLSIIIYIYCSTTSGSSTLFLSKANSSPMAFIPSFTYAELPCTPHKYFKMPSLLCGTNFNAQIGKSDIYFPSLQLKFYSAFAFNICPLPVFATVYGSEVIYILFLPLIFPLEVGANKWENDQKGGRCQAKEKGVRQEKPMK